MDNRWHVAWEGSVTSWVVISDLDLDLLWNEDGDIYFRK